MQGIALPEIGREKIRQGMLDKYGVENAFQSEEIKDRIKETNIEKYGFDLKPQDSLSVGPAHYSPLWTLFHQDCEYLSDTLFDMLRAVLLQKSDPPPSILHVTNPIKEDADLRGSNTGRHWLADFDDTAGKG